MHKRLLACAAFLGTPVLAQDVLWSNPAGGSFAVGTNWQGGAPPTANQNAVFGVGGTYAITGPAAVQVTQMRFLGGDVTLNIAAGVRLRSLVVGGQSSPFSTLRLQTPLERFDQNAFNFQVSLNNATITGPLSCNLCGLAVTNGSVANVGTILSTSAGQVTVDATSTLNVTGGINIPTYQGSGTLNLTGAVLSLNTFIQTGGRINAINSRIGGDGLGISGGVHTFTNSSFSGQSFPQLSGDVTFTGPGPNGWNIGGGVNIGGGTVRLRNGATAEFSHSVHQATLDVGDGCTASGLRLYDGRVVATGLASVAGLQFYDASARLVIVLDGLNLPAMAPVAMDTFLVGPGVLQVEVVNTNALRQSRTIPLIATSNGQHGHFSTVELPALPGGRMLQLRETASGYELRVLAGGSNPCWTSDFNGDDDYGTDQDIEAFFACLAGHCCPTCGSADFNSDGDTGTEQDIEAFFRILGGGAC